MNSAIKVGDVSISNEQLQNSINSILSARKAENVDVATLNLPTGANLTSEVVQSYLRNLIIDQVASDQGITFTPAALEKFKANFINQIGGANILPATLAQHDVAMGD